MSAQIYGAHEIFIWMCGIAAAVPASKSNQPAPMLADAKGFILFKTGGREVDTQTADSLTANLCFDCVINHFVYFDDAVCND